MSSNQPTLLCSYGYDSLDRLIHHSPADTLSHQRFYCKSRLATEIQGVIQYSIVQYGDLLLAQQQRQGDKPITTLLATDLQRSILHAINENHQQRAVTYSPYGYRPMENGLLSLLGFNGERPDPLTGYYLLGNGYRAFSSTLMRFNRPDNLSPFGKGGLNPYGYCSGDPINFQDPTGHFIVATKLSKAFRSFGNKISSLFSPASKKASTQPSTFISDPFANLDLQKYDALQNHYQSKLASEFQDYQNLAKKQPLINQIINQQDLNSLNPNTKYKFILTKDGRFITGAPTKALNSRGKMKDTYMKHTTLDSTSDNPVVISAGYIKIKSPTRATIDNRSGHFETPIERLQPVSILLENMGFKVKEVRHQSQINF
jgi:RHS repeat-associated protein